MDPREISFFSNKPHVRYHWPKKYQTKNFKEKSNYGIHCLDWINLRSKGGTSSWFGFPNRFSYVLGWQWGGTGPKDRVFVPTLHGFVLPHPRHLGPREARSHPVKLYFLLIYPTTSTIFLMKPISLIKIYLKLQLNLSHQIKSLFRKKLNNISKHLTRWLQKKIL